MMVVGWGSRDLCQDVVYDLHDPRHCIVVHVAVSAGLLQHQREPRHTAS